MSETKRPTISELQATFDDTTPREIIVQPDGSVDVTNWQERAAAAEARALRFEQAVIPEEPKVESYFGIIGGMDAYQADYAEYVKALRTAHAKLVVELEDAAERLTTSVSLLEEWQARESLCCPVCGEVDDLHEPDCKLMRLLSTRGEGKS